MANMATEIEENFPEFNSESDSFNETAKNELLELYAGYVAAGKGRLEALRKSLEVTTKMYDMVGDDTSGEDAKAERRKKDTRRKVKEQRKQPPEKPTRTKREAPSKDYTAQDIANLSDDEFDSLTPAQLARARGDII